MENRATTAGLLRLMQIADSAFPIGGFSYSHGLEWLAATGRVTNEAGVGAVLDGCTEQVARRQWFPAALAAMRAKTLAGVIAADDRLDASITAKAERDGGRLMGRRLLAAASDAIGGEQTAALLRATQDGRARGQYPVAFAVVGEEQGVQPELVLAALGQGLAVSITSAAVRLGVIGQAAGVRQVAAQAPRIESAAAATIQARRRMPGAFTPVLDVAILAHHTLPFRVFAS